MKNAIKYVSWIKPDFDIEAYKVKHPGLTDTQVITNALQNTVNYQHNMVSIPYPNDRDTLTQSFKYTNIINSYESSLRHIPVTSAFRSSTS